MIYRDTDLAYLAGFIDADGFIAINRYCPRKNDSDGRYGYNLRIGAVNTQREVLEWIQNKFGGYIYKRKPSNPEKHRIAYAWYLDSKKAEAVLRLISPYLKRKKLQANIAIKFRETYDLSKYIHYENGKNIGLKIPEGIVEKREELRQEMKTL